MLTRIASQRFIRVCETSAILRAKTSSLIIAGRLASTNDCLRLRQSLSSDAYPYWWRRAGSRQPWLPKRRPQRYRSFLRSAAIRSSSAWLPAIIGRVETRQAQTFWLPKWTASVWSLHELMPNAARVGLLLNPNFPAYLTQLNELQQAAAIMGLQVEVLRANTDGEIGAAFETASRKRIGALILAASPFFDTRRDKLVALAAGHALPTIYHFREFAVAGGLMSYGVSIPHIYRQVGVYTGRILSGENPANLPVQQPTTFELVINLKTAKALGLEIPPTLLARADEVIE